MDSRYLDRICAVLDDMGVHHLRVAPQTDTVLVQVPEGFATFQWYERLGYVLAIHSLHDTRDIPPDVRSELIELAGLAGISTWEADDDTVRAIAEHPRR